MSLLFYGVTLESVDGLRGRAWEMLVSSECFPNDTGFSGAEIGIAGSVEGNPLNRFSPFRDPRISFNKVQEQDLSSFVLHPLEEASVGEAVSPKRRMDFMLGRMAARGALAGLGHGEVGPILRGEHREPLWPKGTVGSISHSGGFGVAAVARQEDFSGLGIDIQQVEDRYSDELIARFADPDEFDWVRSVPSLRTERAVKLFSAKESVFKALYPVARVWFAFDAAKLAPRDGELGFSATVRLPAVSSGVIHLEVDVALVEGFVITGALLVNPLPVVSV